MYFQNDPFFFERFTTLEGHERRYCESIQRITHTYEGVHHLKCLLFVQWRLCINLQIQPSHTTTAVCARNTITTVTSVYSSCGRSVSLHGVSRVFSAIRLIEFGWKIISDVLEWFCTWWLSNRWNFKRSCVFSRTVNKNVISMWCYFRDDNSQNLFCVCGRKILSLLPKTI